MYTKKYNDNFLNNWDLIENIITFLEDNEQYGDNWSKEIKVLKKLLEETCNKQDEKHLTINK